jgi:hypothetical protein
MHNSTPTYWKYGHTNYIRVIVDLSFLKKGSYQLFSMKDDKASQAIAVMENATVKAGSKITVELNPEGGFVGRFDK